MMFRAIDRFGANSLNNYYWFGPNIPDRKD